jgi:hypothetical protein
MQSLETLNKAAAAIAATATLASSFVQQSNVSGAPSVNDFRRNLSSTLSKIDSSELQDGIRKDEAEAIGMGT